MSCKSVFLLNQSDTLRLYATTILITEISNLFRYIQKSAMNNAIIECV